MSIISVIAIDNTYVIITGQVIVDIIGLVDEY